MKAKLYRASFGSAIIVGLALGSMTTVPCSGQSVPTAPNSSATTDAVSNSVVQIFSTLRFPDMFKPWKKGEPVEISGSGFVIEGRRILTNAHVVLYASRVEIQGHGAGDRISATVESIDTGIDLAVLRLEDDTFFDSHPALPRSSAIPHDKDPVLVYGYPTGGTGVSVTKGIVSRVEFTHYSLQESGLRVQIDAAVNHGNSGGPALAGDRVIGVAYSFLNGAQNIGYIIPTEEIELFLKSCAGGPYKGKPGEFSSVQNLHNLTLRRLLKVPLSEHGVVVQHVGNPSPDYPLKSRDVIVRIGDTALDDEGMVTVEGDLKVTFDFLIQRMVKDGVVPITVLREGKEVAINLPVENRFRLLNRDLQGTYPPYFILGPIAFSEASLQLVSVLVSNGPYGIVLAQRESPIVTRSMDFAAFDGEALVFVPAPFFPHPLTKGYGDPQMRVVAAVNGVRIRNLAHLVQTVRDSSEKYISIEFADERSERLVFPREEMIAATGRILADNGIRSQGSDDMMKVWNARAATP
jgi:S1-C subfamily serine protease